MVFVKGPNGLVIGVADQSVNSLVGDGSCGYEIVPDPRDTPEPVAVETPAPRKRAPRKPPTK